MSKITVQKSKSSAQNLNGSNGKSSNGKASANGKVAGATPRQLATPTDLKPEEIKAVTEAVNPIIADSFALYLKTKNFHWHLSGSHFRDYHLMFDEQAEAIFASIDDLAERVRRIGGTTLRSISHVSQLQTIDDDNNDFVAPGDMIARLLADNRKIAKAQREAIELTEDKRDHPTSDLLQQVLNETERRIWFLFEVSQGADNTQ